MQFARNVRLRHRKSSKKEVQKELTRAGIEPNPGPSRARRALRKVWNATKKVARFAQAVGKTVVPEHTFANAGAVGGTMLGGPAGGAIGGFLGDQLSRVVGFGDYVIKSNSYTKKQRGGAGEVVNVGGIKVQGGPMPSFSRAGQGIRISHREYVCDITGSAEFANTGFLVNASNEHLFPWLSHVAHYFEEYTFKGLLFEYRPTSGAFNGATQALGSVIYATNYNCMEANFATKAEMDSYEYVTSCLPCVSMIHPVECMPGSNPVSVYYTKAVDSPDAQLMYDMGNFQVGTQGMNAANVVGELWVSYDIVLTKPRVNVRGPTEVWSHYTTSSSTAAAATAFGNPVAMTAHADNRTALTFTTTTVCLPHTGYYLMAIMWSGSGANITAAPSATLGAHITSVYGPGGQWTNGGTSSSYWSSLHVTVPGTGADNLITIGGNTGMITAACTLCLTETPVTTTLTKLLRSPPPDVESVDSDDYETPRKKKSLKK